VPDGQVDRLASRLNNKVNRSGRKFATDARSTALIETNNVEQIRVKRP
jgi:hypothetical protein